MPLVNCTSCFNSSEETRVGSRSFPQFTWDCTLFVTKLKRKKKKKTLESIAGYTMYVLKTGFHTAMPCYSDLIQWRKKSPFPLINTSRRSHNSQI